VEWIDNLNLKELDQQAEANLASYETQMAADPFLESCFDEWKSQYHYGYSLKKNIEALQRAMRKGYPAAHLCFKLGYFLYVDHRLPEARAAFEQALRQKPDYTDAAGYLQLIDQRFSGK
jgi:tetratricopeptide (TPR) repeat protein